MNKKHLYFLAIAGLIAIRVLILNTNFPLWLQDMQLTKLATTLAELRSHTNFLHFMGGWVLPVFVFAVIIYWLTEEDEERIPKQFWLLPIVYLGFMLIADTLSGGVFNVSMLTSYPIVILPYGYAYIAGWALLIWVLKKAGLVR